MRYPRLAILALCLAGCAPAPRADTSAGDAALSLVRAAPADWPQRSAAALAHETAPRALMDALRDEPDGPGAVCAVAALGACPDPEVRTFLEDLLVRDGEMGSEAALALGRLGDPDATTALRAAVAAENRTAAARTAAAAALLDLGDDATALPFLATVILAGTPAGAADRERTGLPDKARWALERTIAIDAVGRRTGGETFGMDPDLSWPDLAAAVARMRSALAGEPPR